MAFFFIAILLVLPIEEISLGSELSRPLCFRIQVGYRERDGGGGGARTDKGLKSLCIILDIFLK